MSTTPNLGLELIPANSLQPWVAVNDALQVLDALVQLAAESITVTAPPAATAGQRWIVPAGATGDWAGQEGAVALCTAPGLWRFIAPQEGFKAWVVDEAASYRYTSGSWTLE